MNPEYIRKIEGSSPPPDIFQPHMPDVGLFSNMDAIFADARSEIAQRTMLKKEHPDQRYIAIVTPGRMVMYEPCPTPGSIPSELETLIDQSFPSNPPLNVSVVTYTLLRALTEDVSKCIPFLGHLIALGYAGHSVVAFEGHPSAFESGVRNSDVLIIDSGMMEFIGIDWPEVAYEVMRPNPKIFIQDRETYDLLQVSLGGKAAEGGQKRRPFWRFW